MKEIQINEELKKKAAELLEQGHVIFLNFKDNQLLTEDEIKNTNTELVPLAPMSSKDFFELMKDFGCIIDDIEFRAVLYDLLGRDHPFSRFKEFIDSSDYRDDWYKYRRAKYIEWVEKQISDYNLLGRITK